MESLLTTLSAYNVVNYFITGGVACSLLKIVFNMDVTQHLQGMEQFMVFYFVGLIVSRLGSIIVEPFYRWLGIIVFADYSDYCYADSVDKKIEILNCENNVYRTFVMLSILLVMIELFKECIQRPLVLIMLLVFLFLFSLSYRKNTQYIVKRVDNALSRRGIKDEL